MSAPYQEDWVDALKGLAMLAVVVNHLYDVVFQSRAWLLYTSFGVSLFVFLGGYTAAGSLRRALGGERKFPRISYFWRRTRALLFPYLTAMLFYTAWKYTTVEDPAALLRLQPELYFVKTLYFEIGPMYYVFFFWQLVMISPFLYQVLGARRGLGRSWTGVLVRLGAVGALSQWLNSGIFFPKLKLAGTYLLGGRFLFVFACGMAFYLYRPAGKRALGIRAMGTGALGVFLLRAWPGFMERTWRNPPVWETLLYSIAVLALAGGFLGTVLEEGPAPEELPKAPGLAQRGFQKIAAGFSYLGRRSYPIYLYHWLVIQVLAPYLPSFSWTGNWPEPLAAALQALAVLALALGGPLLLARAAEKMRKVLRFSHSANA